MKTTMILTCLVGGILLGCVTPRTSDLALLRGAWRGEEAGRNGASKASLSFADSTLEFHGADSREWYKATFSLREDTTPKQLVAVITDCPFPQYVGKTSLAIYEVTKGSLTLTGNEPGNPAAPASFDEPGARKIVFRRE